MNNLLQEVAHLDNLYQAWRNVRTNVRRTAWPGLLAELAVVDAAPLPVLRTIQQQLITETYRFSPKLAYAKRKSGGSRRGITVPGMRDRIVQRAILNVFFSKDAMVQGSLGHVKEHLNISTSFAGAPHRGVPDAIRMVQLTIRNGATAFAYSDMKDFFPCVPRRDVVELLRGQIQDKQFLQLFSDALKTEIENIEDVREWLKLFPISEIGVAQGSLLSTLVGNLSLHDFDARMNQHPIVTVRYLDDFLILAPNLAVAVTAFDRAQQELAQLKMSCYAPGDGSQKAGWGLIRDGFQFLGCHIHPDGISPSRSACQRLLKSIAGIIFNGKRAILSFEDPSCRRRTESAYAQILSQIDRTVRGWGDVYRFATNRLRFSQIDTQIDRQLAQFHGWFQRHYDRNCARGRRRMQGVALLADTPPMSHSLSAEIDA